MKTRVRERLLNERMVAWLAGVFAILAMALVIVGLYGIVAYLASSRRNEIGIRLALGSTRGQIVRLVLRDNLWMMAAGIVIGLPLAIGAMRAARALLYGLSPTDGGIAAGATCLLAVAGVLAAASSRVARGTCPSRRRDALRVSRHVLLSECGVYDLLARAARPRALSVPGSTKNRASRVKSGRVAENRRCREM